MWGMGLNLNGQLGVRDGLGTAAAAAGGWPRRVSLGLESAGWRALRISAGSDHSLILTEWVGASGLAGGAAGSSWGGDGAPARRAWGLGSNRFGQLGIGGQGYGEWDSANSDPVCTLLANFMPSLPKRNIR